MVKTKIWSILTHNYSYNFIQFCGENHAFKIVQNFLFEKDCLYLGHSTTTAFEIHKSQMIAEYKE